MLNRLGIFCFFEEDGIVDEYVEYLLEDLSKALSQLFIVINGKISRKGLLVFHKYTNHIFIRKNTGYDGGAFADVILSGILNLQEWDEVVLCNNSFFGPFLSFEKIFSSMGKKTCRFLGDSICREKNLCIP